MRYPPNVVRYGKHRQICFPPTGQAEKSVFFRATDIFEVDDDLDIAGFGRNKDGRLIAFGVDLLERSAEALEDTGHERDLVAGLESRFFGLGLDLEGTDLRVGERRGLGPGSDEAGDPGDVPNDVPGGVGHDHLDENVAGEYLGLDLFLFTLFIGGDGDLDGEYHLEDHIAETAVLYDLFNVGFDLVFIAGVRMDYVPSGTLVHFIDIAHFSL